MKFQVKNNADQGCADPDNLRRAEIPVDRRWRSRRLQNCLRRRQPWHYISYFEFDDLLSRSEKNEQQTQLIFKEGEEKELKLNKTKNIENLYQEIAAEALECAQDINGKLLFAADVKEGVVSSALVYEKDLEKVPTFKFVSSLLTDLAYELWEQWRKDPKNAEWQSLELVVLNGDFHFDFTYPDQLVADEDFDERREAIFERHFGNKEIDYSNP